MPSQSRRHARRAAQARLSATSSLSSSRDSQIVRSALTRNPSSGSILVRVCTLLGGASANGAGIMAPIVSFNPSGFSDWSSLAALYDEFRVLGAKIKFFCQQQNSITVQSQPVTVVYDNDDATTAITSASGALDYRLKRQFASIWDNSTFPTLQATCYSLADQASGIGWSTTGSPAAYPHSFKVYSSGLTASTTYISFSTELVVQFRGAT